MMVIDMIKSKHLVEINDSILAVFITESQEIKDLYIAKNSGVDKSSIEQIFNILKSDIESKNKSLVKDSHLKNILGILLWDVSEYNKLRILKIYENEKMIVVLIKTNTKLEHTIDNILGYYFDSDEDIPKSLF